MRKIKSKTKWVIVDEADYEWLKQLTWHINADGYASTWSPQNQQPITMHRLIMQAKKGQIVDHINRNKLDNRRCNLRFVTIRENLLNASRPTAKGYYYDPKRKLYLAKIQRDGVRVSLGYFKTELGARRAFIKARKAWEAAHMA